MSGYIDTSTGEALWSSYNGGRAGVATGKLIATKWAQWSSVMDQRTCDFCGWADERFFDTVANPYNPPMHWGCRCIIAYLSRDEYGPSGTSWGNGPPKSSWPPGIKNGMKNGKPTLRNVPPKVKSVSDKAKVWAGKWKSRFGKSMSESGRKQAGRRFYDKWAEMGRFEDDYIRSVVGKGADTDAAIERMNGFIRGWTSSSSRRAKEFGEIMARGNADDVLSFWNKKFDPFHKVTLDEAKTFIRVWDAHKDYAAETMRLSNLSKNGKVTIYRGVQANPGTGYRAVRDSLAAGDMEQSIGTAFIESWSTDVFAARDFAGKAGMVFKKEIDVSDVFAHWQEHMGFKSYIKESEIIWYNWDGTLVPKAAKMLGQRLEVEVW